MTCGLSTLQLSDVSKYALLCHFSTRVHYSIPHAFLTSEIFVNRGGWNFTVSLHYMPLYMVNMGRYRAMTIKPITIPRITVRVGSIISRAFLVAVSVSES